MEGDLTPEESAKIDEAFRAFEKGFYSVKNIEPQEARAIGASIGDFFVAAGHPLTCNGGNPDFSTHHDHEVLMLRNDDGNLVCPECGRVQIVP